MEIMKIKRKVNVVKEMEIEIEIPYFCKSENGCAFYKVVNEKGHTLMVRDHSFSKSIDYSEIFNERVVFEKGNIIIEENEFNEAFNQVLEALKNKNNKVITI